MDSCHVLPENEVITKQQRKITRLTQDKEELREQIKQIETTFEFLMEEKDRMHQDEITKLNNRHKQQSTNFDNLRAENKQLRSQLSDRKASSLLLDTIEIWKPLTKLVHKFTEFDLDKSGYINRAEFHKLCKTIETEFETCELYSLQDQHASSSVFGNDKSGSGHNQGTVDSMQAWSAAVNDHHQWYQIDAIVEIYVAGIVLQGRHNCDQWVKSFFVTTSIDGENWTKCKTDAQDMLYTNCDAEDTKNRIMFADPIFARFIRIHPVSWHKHISLRADVLWVEDYGTANVENLEEEKKMQTETHEGFTFDEKNQLFDHFDVKQTGSIDISEFISVLDHEAIRQPTVHPHRIIQQAMRAIMQGDAVNKPEQYTVQMLGIHDADVLKIKYCQQNDSDSACCICFTEHGEYGFSKSCTHGFCVDCLKSSLTYIMENGKFPAQCPACSAQSSIGKPQLEVDSLVVPSLLNFWVHEQIISIKFAVRFHRQQDRFIQEIRFEELMQTQGMRKCPGCGYVILKNEGCNYIKCPECQTELCWQTGLVAGKDKSKGQCGGGHSCHY